MIEYSRKQYISIIFILAFFVLYFGVLLFFLTFNIGYFLLLIIR
jgi:hypothetical protein